MSEKNVGVVLAHGAWADGSSWSKVIVALQAQGVTTIAAPLPLTSLSDDVAALDRAAERVEGQLVLVGHAYAGAGGSHEGAGVFASCRPRPHGHRAGRRG